MVLFVKIICCKKKEFLDYENIILVIEDEPDINKTISYNLLTEGFEPISAYNLLEADDWIQSNSPDLILLDLMLPDVPGLIFVKGLNQKINLIIFL